jgi:hypothetical protein
MRKAPEVQRVVELADAVLVEPLLTARVDREVVGDGGSRIAPVGRRVRRAGVSAAVIGEGSASNSSKMPEPAESVYALTSIDRPVFPPEVKVKSPPVNQSVGSVRPLTVTMRLSST